MCHRAPLGLAALVVLMACGAANAAPIVIFDSHGFEAPFYSPGALNGQNSVTGSAASGGSAPAVIASPAGHTVGSQAVQLAIPDTASANSLVSVSFPDLIARGYTGATISFDTFRQNDGWVSNFWFAPPDDGTPGFGIQWDKAASNTSVVLPYEFDQSVQRPTVFGRFATTTLTWDFVNKQISATYDGFSFGTRPDTGYSTFTGWEMFVEHDEGTGSGPETMWLDNLSITAVPEPTSTLLPICAILVSHAVSRRRPRGK